MHARYAQKCAPASAATVCRCASSWHIVNGSQTSYVSGFTHASPVKQTKMPVMPNWLNMRQVASFLTGS